MWAVRAGRVPSLLCNTKSWWRGCGLDLRGPQQNWLLLCLESVWDERLLCLSDRIQGTPPPSQSTQPQTLTTSLHFSALCFLRFFFFDVDHFLFSLYWICCNTLCFCSGCFGWEACGILDPQPGIEPTPSALEGEILVTGPPGDSLLLCV